MFKSRPLSRWKFFGTLRSDRVPINHSHTHNFASIIIIIFETAAQRISGNMPNQSRVNDNIESSDSHVLTSRGFDRPLSHWLSLSFTPLFFVLFLVTSDSHSKVLRLQWEGQSQRDAFGKDWKINDNIKECLDCWQKQANGFCVFLPLSWLTSHRKPLMSSATAGRWREAIIFQPPLRDF